LMKGMSFRNAVDCVMAESAHSILAKLEGIWR